MNFKICDKIQGAIETILQSHDLLDTFMSNEEFYVEISKDPSTPLTIERHGSQVSVAHYHFKDGSFVTNADVEFEVYNGAWIPVALQQPNGQCIKVIEREEEGWKVYPTQYDDVIEFSEVWANYLLEQGFSEGKANRIE
jgi:hypothetical protein